MTFECSAGEIAEILRDKTSILVVDVDLELAEEASDQQWMD